MNNNNDNVEPSDPVIAKVGKHELRASDLQGMSSEINLSDSAAVISGYVEQWIRNSVVLDEAERSLSPTIDIKKMVSDYRASLLLHHYREEIVGRQLDTAITEMELQEEYERQKSNFQLAERLVQCRIAKIKGKTKNLDRFYRDWKADKSDRIQAYCTSTTSECMLDEGQWLPVAYMQKILPEQKFDLEQVIKKKKLQQYYKGYEYFVKIIDKKDKGDIPPLSYIEDVLRETIIHRRKKLLLAKMESDLYNKALQSNKIKVYK